MAVVASPASPTTRQPPTTVKIIPKTQNLPSQRFLLKFSAFGLRPTHAITHHPRGINFNATGVDFICDVDNPSTLI
jgi:hypothetical protein